MADIFLILFCCCFRTITKDTQELFLTLCSGLTPSSAGENCDAGESPGWTVEKESVSTLILSLVRSWIIACHNSQAEYHGILYHGISWYYIIKMPATDMNDRVHKRSHLNTNVLKYLSSPSCKPHPCAASDPCAVTGCHKGSYTQETLSLGREDRVPHGGRFMEQHWHLPCRRLAARSNLVPLWHWDKWPQCT